MCKEIKREGGLGDIYIHIHKAEPLTAALLLGIPLRKIIVRDINQTMERRVSVVEGGCSKALCLSNSDYTAFIWGDLQDRCSR